MYFALLLLPLGASLASAGRGTGRPGYGFIGYGIDFNGLVCATTCRQQFLKSPLRCTDAASFKPPETTGHSMSSSSVKEPPLPDNYTATPSLVCRAASHEFLRSCAYCLSQKCWTNTADELEHWWRLYVVNNMPNDPPPVITYGAALAEVVTPPTVVANSKTLFNRTLLANETVYNGQYAAIDDSTRVEVDHSKYGLVCFLYGIAGPIAFSFLRFLPFPKRLASALNARFVYPSLLRPWRESRVTSFLAGDPPTRGQALFIFSIIGLNVVFSSVGYTTDWNRAGYIWSNPRDDILGSSGNRIGVLSFANFALMVLYSSRNNLLLWITNWQHSTYVLLHRWTARLAVFEAVLHTLILYQGWKYQNRLIRDDKLPYWIWGSVATVAAVLVVPFSVAGIRRYHYEFFLITHIILAILTFAGSYWHIIFRYSHQFGYETWLFIVFAIWAFDRVVRVLRIARNGVHRATITPIDDEYVQIDIKGLVAKGHVYIYFLNWRIWENHPFTVASSVVHMGGDASSISKHSNGGSDAKRDGGYDKVGEAIVHSVDHGPTEPGIVFYLRLLDGGTRHLRSKNEVPLMIEGSYGVMEDLSEFPTLVCIAGGVGITSCLPYLRAHAGASYLYWGSRSQALVESLSPLTQHFNVQTVVGKRLNVQDILESQYGDFAVVVSGPPSMMNDVREVVSRLAEKKRVKFVLESFTF
ncbi:hypothetical protein K402DRAFT_399290 [Aulographum hederae CBS 113979]|uniref:Ferric oxidoreductase domain-containing protein n=1 Tax=Aulographum hederae CBS 113979 TaxID=1176131 RepID=A0A6G1GHZ3_9PEZI|nr:hypothetical protein K402DRAFT_399290 [Aulographum hederae CBS 113979]